MENIKITIDDLSSGEIVQLLEEHLTDMYKTSPPESVHALDVDALKSSDITFFSAWSSEQLCGCLAIKHLTSRDVELKSMRTTEYARNRGVASKLLKYALDYAAAKGYRKVSLETGSQDYFQPARKLYEKFGFTYCEPFSDYIDDPNSYFMTKVIATEPRSSV